MIKLKNIITEKKELDAKTIQAVAKMTNSNAHNYARLELSQALRNKKLQCPIQVQLIKCWKISGNNILAAFI